MQRTHDGEGEPFKVSDRVKRSKAGPPKRETGILEYLRNTWVVGLFGACFMLMCFRIGKKTDGNG